MPFDRTATRNPDVAGIRRRVLVQVTGPSSYVANGEAFAAGDAGLGVIEAVIGNGVAGDSTTGIRFVRYNPATGKFVWFVDGGTTAEVAGGVNLSTYSTWVEVVGR